MASAVATPLERRFGRIAGVTEITSTSALGTTQHHAAVRSRSRRRRRPRATCRPRSTPPAASCRRTCRRGPNYRKVNPADAPILILSLTLGDAAAGRRCSTPRTRSSRRRSRRSRASVRSSSAAGSSRRCACRSIRQRSPGSGSALEDVRTALGGAHRRPAQGRRLGRHDASTSIAANDQLFGADGVEEGRSSATRTARGGAPAATWRTSSMPGRDRRQTAQDERLSRPGPGRQSSGSRAGSESK